MPRTCLPQRSREWWRQSPVYAALAMQAWGIHPTLIAALLVEGCALKATAKFSGVEASFDFNKCIRQGSVDSGKLLHAVVMLALASLVDAWIRDGWGINIDGHVLPCLLWVDNFWLFATSSDQCQAMIQQLSDALWTVGLRLKLDAVKFLTTAKHTSLLPLQFRAPDDQIHPVPRCFSFRMLGSVISENGRGSSAVGMRLELASRAFWMDAAVLRETSLALGKRLARFARNVAPVVLHCAGSWSWSQTLFRRLQTWESIHLRWIYKCPRNPQEEWLTWIKRVTSFVRKDYKRRGHVPLTTLVLHRIWAMAARSMVSTPEKSPAANISIAKLFPWKDTVWWLCLQAVGSHMDESNTQGWKHASDFGHRGVPWDWVLCRSLGDD